jgi:predicted kinase
MKKITLMIGLPRSGKSTWIEQNKTNEAIISADDLRYIVYNQRFWSDGEPMMWSIRTMMLKYLMQQGMDIIIDETNSTIARRKAIIDMAKENGYTIIGNVLEKAWVDECVERAMNEGQTDLIPIINRMAYQFEAPRLEEGFDKINRI